MKKWMVIFAILIVLKGGATFIIPGDNILVIEETEYNETMVSVGVIYDADGDAIQKIPMDLIAGIGAISECKEPGKEM